MGGLSDWIIKSAYLVLSFWNIWKWLCYEGQTEQSIEMCWISHQKKLLVQQAKSHKHISFQKQMGQHTQIHLFEAMEASKS